MANSYHRWVERQGYIHGTEQCHEQADQARRRLCEIEATCLDAEDFAARTKTSCTIQGAIACHDEGCSAARSIPDDILESWAVAKAHIAAAVPTQKGEWNRAYQLDGETQRTLIVYVANGERIEYRQMRMSGKWSRGYGLRQFPGLTRRHI